MGFFRKKQPAADATPVVKPAVRDVATSAEPRTHTAATAPAVGGQVRITPYLTEKSSTLAGQGTYAFVVPRDAEKIGIARAITQRYGVTPAHVRTIRTAGKFLRYGRNVGMRSGVKKALVTLKKGETIPFGVKT